MLFSIGPRNTLAAVSGVGLPGPEDPTAGSFAGRPWVSAAPTVDPRLTSTISARQYKKLILLELALLHVDCVMTAPVPRFPQCPQGRVPEVARKHASKMKSETKGTLDRQSRFFRNGQERPSDGQYGYRSNRYGVPLRYPARRSSSPGSRGSSGCSSRYFLASSSFSMAPSYSPHSARLAPQTSSERG